MGIWQYERKIIRQGPFDFLGGGAWILPQAGNFFRSLRGPDYFFPWYIFFLYIQWNKSLMEVLFPLSAKNWSPIIFLTNVLVRNFFFYKNQIQDFFLQNFQDEHFFRYFICSFFISFNTLSYWLKMQIFYTVTGKSYFLL